MLFPYAPLDGDGDIDLVDIIGVAGRGQA